MTKRDSAAARTAPAALARQIRRLHAAQTKASVRLKRLAERIN